MKPINFIDKMIRVAIVGIVVGFIILFLTINSFAYVCIPVGTVPSDAGTITVCGPIAPGS